MSLGRSILTAGWPAWKKEAHKRGGFRASVTGGSLEGVGG